MVLVFYVVGGLVFSNMIHADALTPKPPTPDYGVYVRSVGNDSITLTSEEERSDTVLPGVAGLAWDGGYGQLGEITAVDGLDVTRGFDLVSREMPTSCPGSLDGCDPVDIEGWTYPSDPSDVGLAYEEVEYQSPLGLIGAWQVDSGDGSIWAIHAHGWSAARREALRTLPIFDQNGITSLVIDYRNDPDAPTDPSGLYRFGLTEWEDIEAAVRYAIDNGAEQLILVGYSTGAAAHMAFLENSALADRISAAVFDSPNIDMGATVQLEAGRRTIPGTPIPVPHSLTAVAMMIADLRWQVSWDEINYVERAAEFLAVPTLVFHGLEDARVPVEVSRRFAAKVPDLLQLVEVESAGHVTSWNVDPETYTAALTEFLQDADLTAGVNDVAG